MADVQHIFTGIVNPTTAPDGIGHHYINTATEEAWYSVATATVADWHRAPHVSSGAGVPASTPMKLGDVYIDTTNSNPYTAIGIASSADWSLGGGGGGGSSGPVSDDFTDHDITFASGTETITVTIDTTKHHRVNLDKTTLASNGGGSKLVILLPNSTDLTEVDYTSDVHFTIIVHTEFLTGNGGRFNLISGGVVVQVNGQTEYDGSDDAASATNDTFMVNTFLGPVDYFEFLEVKSTLIIEARLIANGTYAMTYSRDAESQISA